jgi:hypothetical protein
MHFTAAPVTIYDALLKMGLTNGYKEVEEQLAGMSDAIIPAYLHDNIIIPNEGTPKSKTA